MFGKKKKKTENQSETQTNNLEESVKKAFYDDYDIDNAYIVYILLQAAKNNVSVAKRNGDIYIKIDSPKVKTFLEDWYTLLVLNQNGKFSNSMYQKHIKLQLEENGVVSKPEQPKPKPTETTIGIEDIDIFKDL